MWAVDAQGLSRAYRERQVLRGLSLRLAPGELIVLRGENGSGKTTLLRTLATLLTPDSGEVSVFGHSLTAAPAEARRLLAWCPATDAGFPPRLTGIENLRFFAGLRGMSAAETDALLSGLASFRALQASLSTPYYLCSAGMRQSLQLARALLARPRLLLLDEPLRSLDEAGREELGAALARIRSETTVILTTHEAGALPFAGARVGTMREGNIEC